MAPDVCDDCATRFSKGGPLACRMGEKPTCGSPRSAAAAAAVASTHCCGSHFGAIPCMPTGGSPADRMPPRSVADAGDGVPYTVGGGLNTSPRMGDARGLTAGRLVQLPYKPNAVRRGVRPGQSRDPSQRREAWGAARTEPRPTWCARGLTAGRLEHEPLRGRRPRPYGRSAFGTSDVPRK